jgi:hypothetical protein
MNDRHNRLAGCVADAEAARNRLDIEAAIVASGMVEMEDSGSVTPEAVATILRPYRAASESLADALEQLADALRS